MSFAHLRNKIKTKLESLGTLHKVYEYPTEDFAGYPSAVIRTINNDSEYETNCENLRGYVFKLYIIQECEHMMEKQARKAIEGLVDSVMDLFDKDEFLTSIVMPIGKTLMGIRPALSEITDIDGKYVVAEVTLTCKVSFDKNL